MRKRFAIGAILLGLIAPALMAPSGGFPSQPTFQRLTTTTGVLPANVITPSQIRLGTRAALPAIHIINSAAAVDARNWELIPIGTTQLSWRALNDAQTVSDEFLKMTRGAGTITQVEIGNNTNNPAILGNGVAITPSSGSFTAVLNTGCTTTPTFTFNYNVIGTLVFLRWDGTSCTSNATTRVFTGSPVPAAIRPAATRTCVHGAQDAGAGERPAQITVTAAGALGSSMYVTGNNQYGAAPGWTASGTWSLSGAGGASESVCVYSIAN